MVGCKQTEVGPIPKDWSVSRLGENLREPIRNGYSPLCPSQPTGKWILSLSAVTQNGFDSSGVKPAPVGDPKVIENLLVDGDIVISRSNTPDRVGLAGIYRGDPASCAYPDLLMRVRLRGSLSSEFLLNCLLSYSGRRFFADNARGSSGSMVKVDRKIIESFPILLPPVAEQRAIATALIDVDALISGLDQLITKKRDLKQAAMQQLLTGQRRLPGYESKSGFKQTEVGLIPKDWNVGTVKDHASIGTGKRNTQDRVDTGLYPFFVRSQMIERINSFSFEGEAVLTAGDGVGTGKVFHYIHGRFDFHQRVYKISDFSECLDGFFFFLYFSNHFYGRIMSMTAKSSVDSVRMEMIANMFIPLPTIEEQRSIATVLSDMDAELSALETRRDKTRDLKQGMMQELLTGRIRLLIAPPVVTPVVQLQVKNVKNHNLHFNEAVVIAVLTKLFGSEEFPLGRLRYTKLAYLLHRHSEVLVVGYLKKAAGPYNPTTKYGGAEKIAQQNGYIRAHKNGQRSGFVAAEHIAKAEAYFEQWYGLAVTTWLEQFRYTRNEELELFATVDMAMMDLQSNSQIPSADGIKQVIANHPEWKAKLERDIFSDKHIASAIEKCISLFG